MAKKFGTYIYWGALALLALFVLWGGYSLFRWAVPQAPSVYRVAIDPTWYPLSVYGKESSLTAFSTDLLFAVAQKEGFRVEIARSGPKRIFELLDDENVHAILTGIRPDAENEKRYLFSEPYYRFGAVFVVRKEDKFTSLLDLPNKRIAVKRNSPILYRIKIDPKAVIVPFDSPIYVLDQLAHNEVDGVIMEKLLAYLYFSGLYKSQLKAVTLPLTTDGLRLVTLHGQVGQEFVDLFNQGLKEIKEQGFYQQLIDNWALFNPELPEG